MCEGEVLRFVANAVISVCSTVCTCEVRDKLKNEVSKEPGIFVDYLLVAVRLLPGSFNNLIGARVVSAVRSPRWRSLGRFRSFLLVLGKRTVLPIAVSDSLLKSSNTSNKN